MSSNDTSRNDTEMDSGMNGLDVFFEHASSQKTGDLSEETVKKIVQEQLQQQQGSHEGMSQEAIKKLIQEQVHSSQAPPSRKKTKKKSPLTRKPGIYLSEEVDTRLDAEWRNQPRQSSKRKSKSRIVEDILRQHWGLPPLEE